MSKNIGYVVVLVLLLSVVSCGKRKAKKQAEADEATITNYLEENNIDATATGTGLYYIVDSTTNGIYADADANVTVVYQGYYVDGVVFDQSAGSGANFNLQGVIMGWTEGMQLIPEGGKGRLFIPSHLAYGLDDYADIPGGSVLIFEVELLDVL